MKKIHINPRGIRPTDKIYETIPLLTACLEAIHDKKRGLHGAPESVLSFLVTRLRLRHVIIPAELQHHVDRIIRPHNGRRKLGPVEGNLRNGLKSPGT